MGTASGLAETAYLFGSRSTGKNRPDSDYDLAVLWPEPFDPIEGFRLAARMESELRSLCGGEVDLVFLNQASPLLMFEVVRHGKVLYSSDEDRRIRTEMRASGKRQRNRRAMGPLRPPRLRLLRCHRGTSEDAPTPPPQQEALVHFKLLWLKHGGRPSFFAVGFHLDTQILPHHRFEG